MSAQATATKRLTSVSAIAVNPGDEVEVLGERVPVTHNVRGENGQRYLITENDRGGILVHERDPSETVSVWR